MSPAEAPAVPAHRPRPVPLLLLGALIGGYSTLCGIGGGVFAVPLLHYVHRLPLRTAVADSLVLVAASTTSATLLEVAHPDSALRWEVVAALVGGALVGARIGFAIGKRVTTRALKGVFAALLTLVAAHMLFGESSRQAFTTSPAGGAVLGRADLALVVAIGLAAGVVAPLLGIGGGLVAVPALLLSLPGLGFLAARACSMAMSTVAAWQSVWLYRRAGEIRSRAAAWLAGGALLGAAAGIQLVHVEEVTEAARALVALALLFAAARFATDVARGARSGPE